MQKELHKLEYAIKLARQKFEELKRNARDEEEDDQRRTPDRRSFQESLPLSKEIGTTRAEIKGLMASQPGERIPLGHPDANNSKLPPNNGNNGSGDLSFIFKYSRWGGEGYAYHGHPNRKGNDDSRRPRRSGNSGGPPGGDDPNNDSDDEDDSPNGDGSSASDSNNTNRSFKKPRSKLPSLHHKSLEWDGVRAELRVYLIRWYDYLKDFEDTSAIMFLSRCVTPEFKELVLSYFVLVPCLQNLEKAGGNESG